MNNNKNIIELNNISKTFNGVRALKNFDFSIKRGEIHCLVGENGSGKSTLIKIISGVLQPDNGSDIKINRKPYKKISTIDAINEGIEVIFQDLSLFPNLTVYENISINERVSRRSVFINWRDTRRISREALKNIGITIDLEKKVEELSIAQRQLVAIARAITKKLKLLIMDEPTSSLTKKEVNLLFKVIRNLKKKGISILFISHKINEVLEITDRVTVVRDGNKIGVFNVKDIDSRSISKHILGEEISYSNYRAKIEKEKILLEVKNMTRKNHFENINFKLFHGEILGITGLLGSGRTELAISLYGLYRPDSGSIYINGRLAKISSTKDAISYGIAYMPEDRLSEGLFLSKSIGKNIVVNSLGKILNKIGLISENRIKEYANKWLNELGVSTESHGKKVSSLSGGNQQRIVLAKWIATEPRILILDGPTIGIDIGAKFKIYEIIRKFSKRGIGIILISDEIEEVYNNCNRILIMKEGRIIKRFQTDKVEVEQINRILG